MAATDRLTPDQLVAEAHNLLPQSPLVVALGGGADSAVAAWVAEQRPATRCVFVRHGLDGSAALEESAAALGAHLGIGVTFVDAPVEAGPSLESRGRVGRGIDREEIRTVVADERGQAERVACSNRHVFHDRPSWRI